MSKQTLAETVEYTYTTAESLRHPAGATILHRQFDNRKNSATALASRGVKH